MDKVCFVVDRKDLDYQTNKEFNKFSEDSVDSTPDTRAFVKQFKDPNNKLVVTTIQKLNKAIKGRFRPPGGYRIKVWSLFLIMSQNEFGETHKAIKEFLPRPKCRIYRLQYLQRMQLKMI